MYRLKKWLVLGIMTLLLLAPAATVALAQNQNECLFCHEVNKKKFNESVHGIFGCISCHPGAEKFPHAEGVKLDKKGSVAACSTNCHEGLVKDTYAESFHGKAVNLGSQTSATCSDCHSAHEVLSSKNPSSQTSKENVTQTCAKCHGQVSPGFSQGTEHVKFAAVGPGAPMYYTAKFFVWLTVLTITALVIHMELQLYHDLRTILKERK